MKKRILFTLFYADGSFMLSRNFSIQKVGGMDWLSRNYNFSKISYCIDELVILDVSRDKRNHEEFINCVREISKECFVPIAAGGGIRDVEGARHILRNGADKVVINSLFFESPETASKIGKEFGLQSVIASVDAKGVEGGFQPYTHNGGIPVEYGLYEWIERIGEYGIGELYLNSIDRDGTGQGYETELLEEVPSSISVPVILSGGAGKASHFIEGLRDFRINAVATGNLFNFVGDGLAKARAAVLDDGLSVAAWDPSELNSLHMSLK